MLSADRPGARCEASSTLTTYIYANPSVQERLAQGLLTSSQQQVTHMAEVLNKLEEVIDGGKK
jgi:hypothetical protein